MSRRHREILNDPKTDEFYVPHQALKMARRLFVKGYKCEEIARAVLKNMRDPSRHGVLRVPESDRLAIVMSRVEMADPQSNQHSEYQALLKRLQRRRAHRRYTAKQTPEQRAATKAAHRAQCRDYMRRQRADPEKAEKHRREVREANRRRRLEDPDAYQRQLAYNREYRRKMKETPEGRARIKAYQDRSEAKRKHRIETDPSYAVQAAMSRKWACKRHREKKKKDKQ